MYITNCDISYKLFVEKYLFKYKVYIKLNILIFLGQAFRLPSMPTVYPVCPLSVEKNVKNSSLVTNRAREV